MLLAAAPATIGGLLVLLFLHERRHDELFRLAARLTRDPDTALAAALVLHGVSGAAWATVLGATWAATGWPIGPLQGALLALAPWALRLLLRAPAGRSWPDALTTLASQLIYGALLGATYRPGS